MKTFSDIAKFNPYHGKDGRFSTADGAASFTYSPGKSKAHDNAIAREKERTAAGSDGRKEESKPKELKLKGTEKQVEWATNIITEARGNIDRSIEHDKKMIGQGMKSYEDSLSAHKRVKDGFEKVVEAKDEASFWIENRKSFRYDALDRLASQEVMRIRRDRGLQF